MDYQLPEKPLNSLKHHIDLKANLKDSLDNNPSDVFSFQEMFEYVQWTVVYTVLLDANMRIYHVKQLQSIMQFKKKCDSKKVSKIYGNG